LHKTLKQLAQAIAELDAELSRLAKSAFGQKLAQLVSIPGIGEQTAIRLLAHTRQMSRFATPKQLVAFFGLCPRWSQSGTSLLASGSICKTGNASVRTALYLCACSATRCNQACKDLYGRLLAKGKPKKAALIAIANKLLRQAFAVISKNMHFDQTLSLQH
jgi:transposase